MNTAKRIPLTSKPVEAIHPDPEVCPHPKIMVVATSPRADDCLAASPFSGQVGRFAMAHFNKVGITRDNAVFTYVFKRKILQDNPEKTLFIGKRDAATLRREELGWQPKLPSCTWGWLPMSHEQYVYDLGAEIQRVDPNVIIALGAVAMWALTGLTKIGTYRGTVQETWSELGLERPYKVVPTFDHYNVVGGQYDKRPLFVADLRKAWSHRHSPDTDFIERKLWINPTLADLEIFYERYIKPLRNTDQPLAYDIETTKTEKNGKFYRALTCIGFAPDPTVALTIPFYRSGDGNYWTEEQEYHVHEWLSKVLEDSSIKKLTHNGVYDISWLAHEFGIRTMGIIEDTMHMHHALEPELPKSLGVLGSIFTEEQAWKTLHKKATNKRDE